MTPAEKSKARSTDRVILLKANEGATSSTGVVDPRLFNGENKLHAVMSDQNLLWNFKYEHGGLPEPLKKKFTSFDRAYDYATKYFNSRGVKVLGYTD